MSKIIFWGAGKIGKHMLDLWRQFGIQPDFFADNSPNLWGNLYYGIKVLSVQEVKEMHEIQILVTCGEIENISTQLLMYGIRSNDIFKGNTLKDMLFFLISYMKERLKWSPVQEEQYRLQKKDDFSVLFDVQYGFVLGGVEAWVLQMADELRAQDMEVKFITTDIKGWTNTNDNKKVIQLEYRKETSDIGKLMKCLMEFRSNKPCNIVCNFVGYIFWAACMAKALWPQEINLVAVIHNDVEAYYEGYGKMQEIIDYCLITCDRMEQRLIEQGMGKQKILRLAWKFCCENVLKRTYSRKGEPIHIGYAGRIVRYPKRLDLLVEIAQRLEKEKVDFFLEIAGTGEYEEEMKNGLRNLSDRISFIGYVERDYINEFWKKQDIGINCSDYEGRCISKIESMAAGAVPIVTDTSSAKDDIQDGYNGYVVPIGDIDSFVDKICYLYNNRELLQIMGERSHQIVMRENMENDLSTMWRKILVR